MRITFVLPAPIRIPMGGAKVVYQHAARLTRLGHAVTVVMPRRSERGWRGWGRQAAVQVRDALHGVPPEPYYEAEGVRSLVVPTASDAHVPDGDVVLATGVQTAAWVRDLRPRKGHKAYFIQASETFIRADARVTWHYPMARLTCARWLAEEIQTEGLDVLGVVPNAVDPAEFYRTKPVEGRGPRVTALYHRAPVKGPDVLVEALRTLKTERPDVEADVFAARMPSHPMPRWVRVHIRPSVAELRRLYNRTAVVLQTSRSEGWGLVPMEAAACGAAVASSAIEAIGEFLEPGTSVALAPVGDGVALAEAVLELLADEDRRVRFAEAAARHVARFDLDANSACLADLLATLA